MKYRKGFTVLELILVLSIILVLIGIVVLALHKIAEKGKATRIIADLSELRKLMDEVYINELSGFENICSVQGGTLSDSPSSDPELNKKVKEIKQDLEKLTGPHSIKCFSNKNDYCIHIEALEKYFCIDSEGRINALTHPPCSSATSKCQ